MTTQRPPDMGEDLFDFAVNLARAMATDLPIPTAVSSAHERALETGTDWPACEHCGEPVDAQGDRYCPECMKAGAEYRLSGVA